MKKENKKVLADLIKEYGDIKMELMEIFLWNCNNPEDAEYNKERRETLKLNLSKVVLKLKEDFGIEV